jgi:uncharacterized protein
LDAGTEKKVTRRDARRRFLRRLAGGLTLGVGGTAAYGAAVEPNLPRVDRVTVRLRNLPPEFDGFRVAHLSDLHVQASFPASRLRPVIEHLKTEKPDIIALTGDYVNFEESNLLLRAQECAAAFAGVTAPHGFYVAFGNHDFPTPPDNPPIDMWTQIGARPLLDEIVPIERNGAKIYVGGLLSAISRPTEPANVLRQIPPNSCSIILWHEPDRAEETALAGGSLQLSGHTHGGQVVIPFMGPPLLPHMGRKYASGLFDVQGMALYVTRGVGLLPPMLRLNCPPEVALLTLRPK